MLQFVADTKKRNAITDYIFIVYVSNVVSIEHSQSYMRQIIRWDRLIPLYTQWAINAERVPMPWCHHGPPLSTIAQFPYFREPTPMPYAIILHVLCRQFISDVAR